jgi:nicotinamide mononucleotide transporter
VESISATLLEQAVAFTPLELVAVLLAIGYLLLAIRQNIWCWVCAGASTAIYIYLFAIARLYMESALNLFYLLMAVYGWIVWSSGRHADDNMPVAVWSGLIHARAISVIAILSLVSGFLLSRYTAAEFPYIDSLTTWSAVWATFLVARKVLENWWYWLIIDIASIFIYWSRDLQLTSVLFLAYVILIPFGLISWSRTMQKQQTQ